MTELSKYEVAIVEPIEESAMLMVIGGFSANVEPTEPLKIDGCTPVYLNKCDKCDKCDKCGLICKG